MKLILLHFPVRDGIDEENCKDDPYQTAPYNSRSPATTEHLVLSRGCELMPDTLLLYV